MAFCGKCGAQLPDNSTVCPFCGAPREDNANRQQGFYNQQPDYANCVNGADFTDQMDPNDIQQNKAMAILAYFGMLFLVPMLAAPNSRFARFHANQGLVLFILDIALSALAAFFSWVPFLGKIIGGSVTAVGLVFTILGVVNAANGQAKELPLIGAIARHIIK